MWMQTYILITVLILGLLFLQPPLVQAIFSGDPEEIRMLIHKTEDVNALVRDAMAERVLFWGKQGLVDIFCAVDLCSTETPAAF